MRRIKEKEEAEGCGRHIRASDKRLTLSEGMLRELIVDGGEGWSQEIQRPSVI